jgi:hypothetical protein
VVLFAPVTIGASGSTPFETAIYSDETGDEPGENMEELLGMLGIEEDESGEFKGGQGSDFDEGSSEESVRTESVRTESVSSSNSIDSSPKKEIDKLKESPESLGSLNDFSFDEEELEDEKEKSEEKEEFNE